MVAARAGGIPDLVRHEENGLLFDPDHPEEAIAAVQTLLAHRGQRRFYALQGRKTAENRTWKLETERLVDQYRKAIVIHARRSAWGRLRHLLLA